MDSIKWFLGAVVVFGVGVATVTIANTLLPAGSVAQTKGTWVPWALTWAMVWGTAFFAVAVAGFMVMIGRNKDVASR